MRRPDAEAPRVTLFQNREVERLGQRILSLLELPELARPILPIVKNRVRSADALAPHTCDRWLSYWISGLAWADARLGDAPLSPSRPFHCALYQSKEAEEMDAITMRRGVEVPSQFVHDMAAVVAELEEWVNGR